MSGSQGQPRLITKCLTFLSRYHNYLHCVSMVGCLSDKISLKCPLSSASDLIGTDNEVSWRILRIIRIQVELSGGGDGRSGYRRQDVGLQSTDANSRRLSVCHQRARLRPSGGWGPATQWAWTQNMWTSTDGDNKYPGHIHTTLPVSLYSNIPFVKTMLQNISFSPTSNLS